MPLANIGFSNFHVGPVGYQTDPYDSEPGRVVSPLATCRQMLSSDWAAWIPSNFVSLLWKESWHQTSCSLNILILSLPVQSVVDRTHGTDEHAKIHNDMGF